MTTPALMASEFEFGTKAQTLARLRERAPGLPIPRFLAFTAGEWGNDPEAVIRKISKAFGPGRSVAVRSSARDEDQAESSRAGLYDSILNVDAGRPAVVSASIDRVIDSYRSSPHPEHEVLVQEMVGEVQAAGVIFTRDLATGAPYYALAYDDESGLTDTVTGGKGAHKALYLYRGAPGDALRSPRTRAMIELAQAVERVVGPVPLDIEFALKADGSAVLLQARRLTAVKIWSRAALTRFSGLLDQVAGDARGQFSPHPHLLGRRSILGVMPDWNPAEMIGPAPRALAFSLYRHLITKDVWHRSRFRMGYRRLTNGTELMVGLAGRPFIDVRASMNSFLPAKLADDVAERLIDAAMDRLDAHPEYHDRIEFQVVPTVLDFSTDTDLASRYGDRLSDEDRQLVATALRGLTDSLLDLGPTGTLVWAERTIDGLAAEQARRPARAGGVARALTSRDALEAYMRTTQDLGTLPFAVLARHAFCTESLLRSAVARGALSEERLAGFRRSIRTVASDLTMAIVETTDGVRSVDSFHRAFGHVRPGTYDILSARLDQRGGLFSGAHADDLEIVSEFELSGGEDRGLRRLLDDVGLRCSPDHLMEYARRSIIGREYAKFVFTRQISDFLEALAEWGEARGLSREDLSHVSVDRLLDHLGPDVDAGASDLRSWIERESAERDVSASLRLSYVIRSPEEINVASVHRSSPNFVGSTRVEGAVVRLGDGTPTDLGGAIVCIESADPGYDWILAHGIGGLVTQFGGANSHMAIRCAEFGISAAIGCGEMLYIDVSGARRAEIDPSHQVVRRVS